MTRRKNFWAKIQRIMRPRNRLIQSVSYNRCHKGNCEETVIRTCYSFFFFNDSANTEIYTSVHTLSLHDALPISRRAWHAAPRDHRRPSRPGPSSDARSEEHTSELQSRTLISYAVFCLKKKK